MTGERVAPGAIDPTTEDGARAVARLEAEISGWLTTVNPDGQPQSSPVWFLWSGTDILVYSYRRTPRNENIAERPLVAFSLHTDPGGGDVATMEGEARIDLTAPTPAENETYLAKYRAKLAEYGWTAEWFAAEYPVPIRIRPTRWRFV